jgi:hypothetical protein
VTHCEPICDGGNLVATTTTRVMEPNDDYVDRDSVLRGAPPRDWLRLVIEDVPAYRCRLCGELQFDADVAIHMDRLVVAHWHDTPAPDGCRTVSYRPPGMT